MKTGWELPNLVDGLITPVQWKRWELLGGKVFKARGYHLRKETLDMLSVTKPLAILRPNGDGDFDVHDRITELRVGLITLLQWPFSERICVLDNEPNWGGKKLPADYWDKIAQVVDGLEDLRGNGVRIASPPMAVMQGEEEWDAGADFSLFDLESIHLYGQLDNGFVNATIARAQKHGLPLLADEVGDSHKTASDDQKASSISSYLRIAADAGVEAATIFIMGQNGDWPEFELSLESIQRHLVPTLENQRAA